MANGVVATYITACYLTVAGIFYLMGIYRIFGNFLIFKKKKVKVKVKVNVENGLSQIPLISTDFLNIIL